MNAATRARRAAASGLIVAITVGAALPPPPAPDAAANGAVTPRHAWATTDGLVALAPRIGPLPAAEVASRLAIADAFARWGIAYDEGNIDVVRSLFTHDATYQVVEGAYKPGGEVVGRAAIAAMVANAERHQADQRRHLITNVVIQTLTDRQATALAYAVVVVAANGLSLGATVIYSTTLRRESDGVWRFSRFVIGLDHYAGRPAANH